MTKKIYLEPFKKCPGLLYFTLLSLSPLMVDKLNNDMPRKPLFYWWKKLKKRYPDYYDTVLPKVHKPTKLNKQTTWLKITTEKKNKSDNPNWQRHLKSGGHTKLGAKKSRFRQIAKLVKYIVALVRKE